MALKPLNSVGGFSVGEIPANVILANADITANKATFNGNVLISPANNAAYGILTDNLYYANGVPWDMQQAAGSNGELQFNLNDDFAASANLLWDNANSNLTITGNANVTGTLIAGTIETDEIKNGTSNVAIPVASGNVNISAAGTANVLAVTGTGVNVAGTFNTGAGNANVGNLGTDTAIITTGNITTINSGLLQNGTTNVTLTPSGNVATYIAGNATAQLVVASTGVNVAGYANIVGNANIGNIGTAELVATGNITGANLMGPLANGTSNVSIPAVNGNVNVTVGGVPNVLVVTGTGVNVAGTLNTGAGNANVGNLGTDTAIITTGNITTINSGLMQNGTSNVTITGSGNISTYVAGNATAQLILTSTGANIAGYANVAGNANVGNLGTNQIVTTGNISISNATPTNGLLTDNLYYSNGVPWDLQEPAGNTTEVQFNNNGQFGASANFTFNNTTNVLDVNGNLDVSDTAIIQGNVRTPNIQSAGNLTVTTDFGVDNNQFVFTDTGNVVMPGNTKIVNTSGNISIQSGGLGKYAELLSGDANTAIWVEDSPDGAYIGANLTGTPVTWNFKTNGDLVTNPGNITIGANGNIVASTFIGDLEGNVLTNVGNTFVLFSDDGQITGASGFTFDKLSNLVTMTGNLNLGPSGENQVINLSSTALEVRGGWNSNAGAVNIVAGDYSNSTLWGKLSIQGNVSGNSVGYSEANVFVFTTPGAGAGNVVRVDTLNTAAANTTSGALQVAGGLGVTGNGYFGNLSVTGDIANANNISVTNTLAANVGNFSGNITSLNANLGNLVDANIIRTGQLYNGNSNIALTANGNILFSVEGLANVHTFSKDGINVVGYVEANGNGTFGALHSNTLTAQGGNLTIYAAAGNNYVELRPTGTGQVDVGNFRIQNLGTPNAGADAATKAYVDNAIEGLTWKQAAQLLSNVNVPLSGTTNTLSIDGHANLTSADNGYRLVLINQTTSTEEGIYVYNDTGNGNFALTRSTDADTYQELEGAAIFILEGNTYANTGWTQTNHYLTSFAGQDWIQFAGGGAYTGANGISVVGTIISANTDGITTEIAGGNIVVKANAQFTTPDIGAATGTSLDLTGNAQVNNLNSNLKVTTTDLEATGNIIAANISANANLLVSNATVNLHLSGNTANFTGNVILPNVTVNLELAGNTANFTGNLIAANVQANGLANVGNLNVVANVTSDLLPNANLTLDLGASAQRWDNVYAGNLDASGNLVVAGSFSANTLTGNVLHANNQVEIGNTKIIHGEVTTTTTTANQTIATFTQSGITGVEYLVKGMDAAGSKYTVATVVAVTDGANVDYSTFATVIIGGTTGTLAVNINGSNIDLQVTPSSSNSTVWVTQYRTI